MPLNLCEVTRLPAFGLYCRPEVSQATLAPWQLVAVVGSGLAACALHFMQQVFTCVQEWLSRSRNTSDCPPWLQSTPVETNEQSPRDSGLGPGVGRFPRLTAPLLR